MDIFIGLTISLISGLSVPALFFWYFRREERKEQERMILWRYEQLRLAQERARRQAYIQAILKNAMNQYQAPKKVMTWWAFLEVPQNASKDEINRAYKRKARVMHPDMGGSDKMMATLNRARELGLRGK